MTKRLNWKKNQTLKNGSRFLNLLLIIIGIVIFSSPSDAQNICRIKNSHMDPNTGQMIPGSFIYVGPPANGVVGGDYPCDAKIAISLEDETKFIHSSASHFNSTFAGDDIDYPDDGAGDNGKRLLENNISKKQIQERVRKLEPGFVEGPYGIKWTLQAKQLKALYPSSTFDAQYRGEQRTMVDYQNLFFEMLVAIQLQAKQSDEQLALIEQQAATIEQLNERLERVENELDLDVDLIPYKTLGEVNIHPNPNSDGNLSIKYQLNDTSSNVQLIFADMNGKIINQTHLNQTKGNEQLNINLPTGAYLYYLANHTQKSNTQKLIIQ